MQVRDQPELLHARKAADTLLGVSVALTCRNAAKLVLLCGICCVAGHVRAAASTCLAALACHPIGAKGDSCLHGPFREQLLSIGAFGALLKAALACSADDPCNAIIQQTAAVGIMYMSTMVRCSCTPPGNGFVVKVRQWKGTCICQACAVQ